VVGLGQKQQNKAVLVTKIVLLSTGPLQ